MDENNLNQFGSSSFQHVSLVPDYRAWQIIQEQSSKIDSILKQSNCDQLLRKIAKEEKFHMFRKSLGEVEQHIKRNSSLAVEHLDRDRSHLLATQLRQHFNLTPSEIVMVLNQMPNHESIVELMFAGRFSKEQIDLLLSLVQQFLPVTSENLEKDQFTDLQTIKDPLSKPTFKIKNEES